MSVTKQRSNIKTRKKKPFSYSRVIFSKAQKKKAYHSPQEVYASLDQEFHFTARDPNKTGVWPKRVFLNGYGDPEGWVTKTLEEISKGHTEVAVLLLKGDVSTTVYHDYIIPFAYELRAVRGRLKLGRDQKGNSPFGSIIAIFRRGPRIAKWKRPEIEEEKEKMPKKKKNQKKQKPKTKKRSQKKKAEIPLVDPDLVNAVVAEKQEEEKK